MTVCRKSPQMRAPLTVPKLFISGNTDYSYMFGGACKVILPALRYNKILSKWEFSHDGTNYYILGTGGSGGSGSCENSTKIVEILNTPLSAGVIHYLPGGRTYTLGSGSKLDVYMNGQMLTHDQLVSQRDYREVTTDTLDFHFEMPAGTVLSYVIKCEAKTCLTLDRTLENISLLIPAGVNHVLPNSKSYVLGTGKYLDVYLNGQLLNHDSPVDDYDYVEVNTTTIRFHYDIPSGAILTYVIKTVLNP